MADLRDDLAKTLAEALAKHRYEKYDSHFSMPGGISWEEYKADDPEGAEGVYLADARDDLTALIASGAVRPAAGVLAGFAQWVASNRAYNGSEHQHGQSLYNECLNGVLGQWASDYLAAEGGQPLKVTNS